MHDGPLSERRNELPATILGIDPSLLGMATAVAYPSGDGYEFDVSRFSADARGTSVRARMSRCGEVVDLVMQVCDRYSPDLILIEGYSFASSGNAALDLAELGGFLRSELCTLSAEILEVAPPTLKKYICGSAGRGVDKIRVVSDSITRWGVGFGSSDEFDAYGLVRLGLCLIGHDEPRSQAEREVMAKVLEGRTPRGGKRSAATMSTK